MAYYVEDNGTASSNTITFKSTREGTTMYIDPKTLKPCKHRWVPTVTEMAEGWSIAPECDKCGIKGSPDCGGVSLKKLIKQLG